LAKELCLTTGRRKDAVARVRLVNGDGQIKVNGRGLKEYFCRETLCAVVKQPLLVTDTLSKYDVVVNVCGGGVSGQAGAVCHGIARALTAVNQELRGVLKKAGFLTRDSRMKERKKYGQKGARARFQFSKR